MGAWIKEGTYLLSPEQEVTYHQHSNESVVASMVFFVVELGWVGLF